MREHVGCVWEDGVEEISEVRGGGWEDGAGCGEVEGFGVADQTGEEE